MIFWRLRRSTDKYCAEKSRNGSIDHMVRYVSNGIGVKLGIKHMNVGNKLSGIPEIESGTCHF